MDESSDQRPKQTTEKGLEIPVPTRDEWERNMSKVAPEPAKSADDSDDESDERD